MKLMKNRLWKHLHAKPINQDSLELFFLLQSAMFLVEEDDNETLFPSTSAYNT